MFELETYYLDVGQGDCSLIVVRNLDHMDDDPNFDNRIVRVAVYDCGSDGGSRPARALLKKCRDLRIERIDVAVISHFDKDHYNGFIELFSRGKTDTEIQRLFQDTQLYTQGCIFKSRVVTKEIRSEGRRKEKKSARFFSEERDNGDKLLLEYSSFLLQIKNFKRKLEPEARFEHVTERNLAGFPDGDWSKTAYDAGKRRVEGWRPTISKDEETRVDNFTGLTWVKFNAMDTLIGKDLFSDSNLENIPVSLECIAVNTVVAKPSKKMLGGHGKSGDLANSMSLTCLLKFHNYAAFFGGDLEYDYEEELIPVILEKTDQGGLTVLKAGHHGADTSTSRDFLEGLKPTVVVITCGESNVHGHPALGTISELERCESIEKVLISGFGVRRRTLKDLSKADREKYTETDLEKEYLNKLERYQRYGVPVNYFDMYRPDAKFALAGSFKEYDDGSIRVLTKAEDHEQPDVVSFEYSFNHVFTHMTLKKNQGGVLAAFDQERSVEILSAKLDDFVNKWGIDTDYNEENEEILRLTLNYESEGEGNKKERKKRKWVEIETHESTVREVVKKQRTDE